MKKLLCSGLLLASSLVGVHGQSIRYGVRAGVNVSTTAGPGTNKDLSLGHDVGLLANVALTPDNFFSFQPELLYSRKGVWLRTPSFTAPTQVRLHYLNIPLLAKIKAGGLVLEAGPQVGFLLSLHDYNPTLSLGDQRSFDSYQRWELGYLAGIGYELRNGLGVGLRYNAGLTPVRQVPNNATPMYIRNASIQLQLSYLVPRG